MQTRRGLRARAAGALGWMSLLLLFAGASGPAVSDGSSPGTIEFVGKNRLATAQGTFHTWRIVQSAVDLADPSEGVVIVEVDLSSVDTGIRLRDDHLRDPDFFEVDTYPLATVRAHSAKPEGSSESGKARFSVQFDLDLHGVQKTIEGHVVLEKAAPIVFEGRLEIDRTDFGIGAPQNRWSPMSIDAEIPIQFRVELETKAGVAGENGSQGQP